MSLILDALRKADHDRKVEDDAGSLDDIYRHENEPDIKSNSVLIGFAILVFILLIGTLAFFVFGQAESEVNQNTATHSVITRSENAQVTSKKIPETDSVPSTQASMPTEISTDATVNTTKDASTTTKNRIDVSSLRQTQVEQQYRTNTEAKTPRQDDILALYDSEKPEPIMPVNATENPAAAAALTNEPETETDKNSLAAYRLTPSIKELLPSVQRDIPTMMYQNHQYVDGGRSSVTIGGKRLYEGNSPVQGVIIQRILKDGIIVKYNQTEFKMTAMNSWINF